MSRPLRHARTARVLLLGVCSLAAAWTVARPLSARLTPRRTTRNAAPPVAPREPLWHVDTALSARVRDTVATDVGALDAALARLASSATPATCRAAFGDARLAYKRIEGMLASFAPQTVVTLNATEAEEGDDAPDAGRIVPHGFPRIEAWIGTNPRSPATHTADSVRAEVARMRTALGQFRATLPYFAVADAQLLDVARLELARVSTLGIAGVDAGPSNAAIRDGAAAVDGVRALVADVARAAAVPALEAVAADRALARAAAYLRAHPDFARFDRFAFVTRYANPAFAALARLDARVPAPDMALRRVWPRTVASVYDARAFDAMAYAATDAPRPTPALVALGRELFADPALSGDGARSCASCHLPARGFTDGRARAAALGDGPRARPFARHTPRLAYAAWQPAQFADARAATLEAQVDSVLASPSEMGSSSATAAAHLAHRAEYRPRFAQIAGASAGAPNVHPGADAVTPRAVREALAAYVRSLGRFDSRFDRAVRGEGVRLTTDERGGFNLFMGRARCGTCHFAPLFNGTAPPEFVTSSVEVLGVPTNYSIRTRAGSPARVDPDSGRAALDRRDAHLHAFKTPTVRGVALGGPFMHNGALRTLDAVLDFYDRGGGAGLGVRLPNQTLSADPLHLTPRDRRVLIAFLRSLTPSPSTTN